MSIMPLFIADNIAGVIADWQVFICWFVLIVPSHGQIVKDEPAIRQYISAR